MASIGRKVWVQGPCLLRSTLTVKLVAPQSCRRAISTGREVQLLKNGNVDFFREHAFEQAVPAIFPRGHFAHLPAISRWFVPRDQDKNKNDSEKTVWELNREYLEPFGDTLVPLELTQFAKESSEEDTFYRENAPLSVFLTWTRRNTPGISLYLAQAPTADLPQQLRSDVPVPEIATHAGIGDIYNTNLWIGRAPTYTPLHRDPNPNLFVQLAGRKVVRLFPPDVGLGVFEQVRKSLGGDGGPGAIRGEEMMAGKEKKLLEKAVWEDEEWEGFEAHLDRGDGLFIPKGWWHSIKGVDEGITASVNWWFR